MYAKLTFNLKKPGQRESFYKAFKAEDAFAVIDAISEKLRNLSKYQNKKSIDIQELRDFINEEISSKGLWEGLV